ncbi:MAG: alpha/beta hydrolase [Pseudolysinimonas sp.]
MPSLLSRLVPLYFRATRANRIYVSTEAADRHVEKRRRQQPVATAPRRIRREFDVTTDTSRGWPVATVTPRAANGRAVVYVHGGAWVNDIVRPHWQLIGEIARAGTTVVVPLYPLVPFGTAKQVVDAVVGLVADSDIPTSLAGDSAGGQIALSAALVLRDRGHVVPMTVLIAPALDLAMRNPEMDVVQPTDPWIAKPGTRVFVEWWRGELPVLDPRVSPIEGELAGLGPLLIFSGTRDILNPDARLQADRARTAGVEVEYHQGEGLVHVYPLTPTREGRDARRRIVSGLSA